MCVFTYIHSEHCQNVAATLSSSPHRILTCKCVCVWGGILLVKGTVVFYFVYWPPVNTVDSEFRAFFKYIVRYFYSNKRMMMMIMIPFCYIGTEEKKILNASKEIISV